jgi:hypothetical protein
MTIWPIKSEVPMFDDEYYITNTLWSSMAAQLTLSINRHRRVGDDNF